MTFKMRVFALILSLALPAAASTPTLGFDTADLSTTIRPQDDFFGYVNGRWLDTTAIPPEWPSYGAFQVVQERTEQQLRELIEGATDTTHARTVDEQKLGDLYASFVDEARVETVGTAPLATELSRIAALSSHDDVMRYFGRAVAIGIEVPLNFYVESAADDPTRNLPYFTQDGLGLPDRDYYLKDGEAYARIRAAYESHIERLLGLVGIPDGAAAAKTITGIELELAKRQWSSTQNRDRERIYNNRFTLKTAERLSGAFEWRAFLQEGEFPIKGTFVLSQDDYFGGLGDIVRARPVADWQTYLKFKYVKSLAPFLSAPIVAENFDFDARTLRGQQEQ